MHPILTGIITGLILSALILSSLAGIHYVRTHPPVQCTQTVMV